MLSHILRFVLVFSGISPAISDGLTITQYPTGLVTRGSIQPLSWSVPANITLQMVKIDLFQGGILKSNLGNSQSDTRTFQWHVARVATYGNNYYLKVTGTSTQGKVAWANSPSFAIGTNTEFNTTDTIAVVISIIFIISLCLCCWKRQQQRSYLNSPYQENRYNSMPEALPTTYPSAPPAVQSYPVVINPAPSQRTGYSGTTVAGAVLAGAVGGAVLEDTFSHHNHGGGGGGWGGGSRNDFGGGSFGGDNAGDSGGGF